MCGCGATRAVGQRRSTGPAPLYDSHAGSQHPVAILAGYTAVDQTVTLVSGTLQEMISQF